MPENMLMRMKRSATAALESAVDWAERASGPALMKESVRQVEANIVKARQALAEARQRGEIMTHREQQFEDEMIRLKQEAGLARDKGRDDLVRVAAARTVELRAAAEKAAAERERANVEAGRLTEIMSLLDGQLSEMQAELTRYQEAQDSRHPSEVPSSYQAKANRAQEAFDRVMGWNARSDTSTSVDAASIRELESLRRDEAVDALLAEWDEPTRRGSKPKKSEA